MSQYRGSLVLLEVDNLAFLHGLGERTRMEAEQYAHAGARVTKMTCNHGRRQIVCVVTIPCSIFGGVCGHSVIPTTPTFLFLWLPLCRLWLSCSCNV